MPVPESPNRRVFLKTGALALFAAPTLVEAATTSPSGLKNLSERSLSFLNLHTGEALKTVYWQTGAYLPSSLDDINRVLRDHRTNEKHEIDPKLLDLLCDLRLRLDTRESLQIISGYRSPITNAMLRSHGGGVAAGSLHMEGRAIDIRLPDVPLASLRDAALDLGRGGVGYYAMSNFVHVDTGRVRRW